MQLDLRSRFHFRIPFLNLCLTFLVMPVLAGAQEEPDKESRNGFVVPDGFEVSQVAGDDLVHDAFCMTLDPQGRPVVSGPGYIKTLIDSNDDGEFDKAISWASLPKQGAQGLWSEKGVLYWVGDAGLWQSVDKNGDLVGDGVPQKLLTLPTGKEHDTHAIRKGPDGYWYLMAGNFANGIASLQNDPSSPIQKPRAGTLWRISPDFKTRSVWCHGLRNTYDFDFLPDGQAVTFDSDDERDMTLPWYRPTRVMVLTPGSDAGWVGDAWKDIDVRCSMPRVIASLGRGSPTGVVVYRHHLFPKRYRDAVLVLDWTFGRVLALYPERVALQASKPEEKTVRLGAETLLEAAGAMGFAPTDLCVEPDGSLLICVGGRGTRGALYRLTYRGERTSDSPTLFQEPSLVVSAADQSNAKVVTSPITSADAKLLSDIVFAPCPLETWSETIWRKKVDELGLGPLANAVVGGFVSEDGSSTLHRSARLGAIRALLRTGLTLATNTIEPLLSDADPDLQAEAWRAIGFGRIAAKSSDSMRWQQMVSKEVKSSESLSDWTTWFGEPVERSRMECAGLLRWPVSVQPMRLSPTIHDPLRQLTLWAASRDSSVKNRPTRSLSHLHGVALFGPGATRLESGILDALGREIAERRFARNQAELLETLAVIQAILGDPRHTLPPQQNTPKPSVFDGYSARFSDQMKTADREGWFKWLVLVANESKARNFFEVYDESIRTLAMLRPRSVEAITFCLSQIDDKSHPTQDINALCALSQCEAGRSAAHRSQTAEALLSLQEKVRTRGLNTDNHWSPRIKELFAKLVKLDSELPRAMIESPEFGTNDHLLFAQDFVAKDKIEAQKKFRVRWVELPSKQWSPSLIRFAVSAPIDDASRESLRRALEEPSLRATAVEILSKSPTAAEYPLFLETLASNDRTAWQAAWDGLSRLPITDAKKEFESLMTFYVRSNNGPAEIPRNKTAERMRRVLAAMQITPPSNDQTNTWVAIAQTHWTEAEFGKLQNLLKPAGDWLQVVERATQQTGDATRGKLLFAQAKCAQCHGSGTALGPDLAGISKRFSREDLFRAIYEPSRDISDRYRALRVLKDSGEILIGMSLHDSADGITLQVADGSTIRINKDEVESKSYATESLMPAGLLDSFNTDQIADLYAYLKTL